MIEKMTLIEIFTTLSEIEKLEGIKHEPIYLYAIQASKRLISALELSNHEND